MAHWLTSGVDTPGYREMQSSFCGMLEDGRHIFDAASNALLGGTDPQVIRENLFQTDQRINAAEQGIRRKIVVHGTVHGVQSFPSLLVLMSLAKDAERIGDYGKNIFDLAVIAPKLGSPEDISLLVQLKDRVSDLLGRARRTYEGEDVEGARRILKECKALEEDCDQGMTDALIADPSIAGKAVACRYFKRVASHVSNVITSLVMPLHKLDFFDEPEMRD